MTLTYKIRLAWWLKPYVNTLEFFSLVTGMTPDMNKLRNIVRHAVRIEGPVKHG